MTTRRTFAASLLGLAGTAMLCTVTTAGTARAEDWRTAHPTLNFAVTTGENAADRTKRYEPVQRYMEKELGVKIAWRPVTDYAGVIQGMITKKIELGKYGPASFAKAYLLTKGQVEPIAEDLDQFGNKGYYSVMVVRADSPYHRVEDLKGKVYAFGDPNSTSSFQAPTYFLTNEGFPPATFFGKTIFSGSHENSVMALQGGTVDGASTWWTNETYSNLTRMEGKGMIRSGWWRIIWKSPQLPSDPWAMPTWLPQQMRHDVRQALLDMPKKDKVAFDSIFNGKSTGFAPGDIKDYQPIIDMVDYNAKHHVGQGS